MRNRQQTRKPAMNTSIATTLNPAQLDQLSVDTIRFLSVDAVQKADSGHPGLPLGVEEVKLTKQDLGWPVEPLFHIPPQALAHFREALMRGRPEVILIATGSEVSLIVEAGRQLHRRNIQTRLVSMPSRELFDLQTEPSVTGVIWPKSRNWKTERQEHEKQSFETIGNVRPIHLAGLYPARPDVRRRAPASDRG